MYENVPPASTEEMLAGLTSTNGIFIAMLIGRGLMSKVEVESYLARSIEEGRARGAPEGVLSPTIALLEYVKTISP